MSNELIHTGGFQLSLVFGLANKAKNTAVAMTLPGGQTQTNSGFVVPVGYTFRPMCVSVQINDAVTVGSCKIEVTDNGTVVTQGPVATLNTTDTTAAGGVQRPGARAIAAGHVVGLKATASADLAPDGTADLDAFLMGELLPA